MTIRKKIDMMAYGPSLESADAAMEWLTNRGNQFGHFIDGSFTQPTNNFESQNPATGEKLAELTQATPADVDRSVTAARNAQENWERIGGPKRAYYLYAIARLLQKHGRLLAVLETLDNGKPIREARDIDVPLAQRHFYYHAGMAQLMQDTLPDRKAVGVCGQIIPWNFPLLMLAWKIAPAIAMGNTIVLKPAEYTSLTALFFAELCHQAHLPSGVVNIITGDSAVGAMIVAHPKIDKIAFTGSTDVGRKIRRVTAGTGKSLTLELGGKSPYIVFEDADLDSAVEGLVDAIWFNQGEVCCAGSRLLVQENISRLFLSKLRSRMDRLRIGNPLDKSIDVGAIVDPIQLETISQLVQAEHGGDIYQSEFTLPEQGYFYPPTLICGLHPTDPLMQEEIFGPVLVSTTFRTPSEAVELANNSRYGLAATIWTENLSLAFEISAQVVAGVVWINATNLFDAASGFGGVRESGFGREGGWEGLLPYTKSICKTPLLSSSVSFEGSQSLKYDVDRTAKLYIGGKQLRPDSGYYQKINDAKGRLIGHVPMANRKDIRNAVESANSAKNWLSTSGHARAQVIYYIAENLSIRANEFASRINMLSAQESGIKEVQKSIDRLFSYAAWADKFDGRIHDVPIRGLALARNEPVGTIGIFCSDHYPLLGLISVIAPAIAMGNTVISVVSEAFPLVATDFYQILETSDVPSGVINILTGSHTELAPHLAGHLAVDAVWSFSSSDISRIIEHESANNLKRTWVNYQQDYDWNNIQAREFLSAATDIKNIWVPYGV